MVYIDSKEVAVMLGVTEQVLKAWRKTGEGPPWYRLGKKLVRYVKEEVIEWVAQNRGGCHEDR